MDPAVDLTLRAALVLLFAGAALHKARDLPRFAATLREYRLLPGRLTGATAVLLVAVEVATAVALLTDRGRGLAAAAAVLTLYAGAMAINLARGRRHIDCGCTGPAGRRPISGWLVGRNLAVAGAAVAALAPVATRPRLWIDGVTVVAATATLAACWAASDRLLGLGPELARLREST
jgi:hypothetical protein